MNVVSEAVVAAVETAASNPKVALATGFASASMGLGAILNEVNSILGTVSLLLGLGVATTVILVQIMKFRLMKREWDKPEGIYRKIDE